MIPGTERLALATPLPTGGSPLFQKHFTKGVAPPEIKA